MPVKQHYLSITNLRYCLNGSCRVNTNLMLVGAFGAAYPVIPLAKAQRTPRTPREEGTRKGAKDAKDAKGRGKGLSYVGLSQYF